MQNTEIRLPKLVENDPRTEKITEILTNGMRKLWSNSKISVASVPFSEKFIQTLQMEHRKGRITRGFELIDRKLTSEAKGLSMVDQKSDTQRGQRVSRLLIISNDGAERYYRKVESLILKHSPRILALIIEADSNQLGELFFGEGKSVKMMLLEHKESVAAALFALIEVAETSTNTQAKP